MDGALCAKDRAIPPFGSDEEREHPCHARPREEWNEVTIEGAFRVTPREMCTLPLDGDGAEMGDFPPKLLPCPR